MPLVQNILGAIFMLNKLKYSKKSKVMPKMKQRFQLPNSDRRVPQNTSLIINFTSLKISFSSEV